MQPYSSHDGMYHQYPVSPFLVPVGLATGSLRYSTLSAAYAGSLVIPLIMLLMFCPTTFKRSPIFPILIINLCLGIALAVCSFIEAMNSLRNPLEPMSESLALTITGLCLVIPIFTDTVLVFKLLRLFPAFQYTLFQRMLLVAIPSLLTIPRVVVMALFLKVHQQAMSSNPSILDAIRLLMKSRLPLIEFSLQLASNSYCSLILLIKAYTLLYGNERTETETYRSEVMMNRLKSMLKIMAGSFLIPVFIQISLVCTFARSKDLNVREPIQWTNAYVSLHCAVLATVWSSIGDVTGVNEEQAAKKAKKQSSSLFVPVDHDEVGEMPNLLRQQQLKINTQSGSCPTNPAAKTGREIIPKRSASTINEGDSVEIMPSPYLLTMQSLSPSSRSTEMSIQRPVYHSSLRSYNDSVPKEAVKYATISAAYAGSLVIPLGLIILFCPKVLRRSPIFPILIINLILGIVLAFLAVIDSMRYVSKPIDLEMETSSLTIAVTSLNFLIPILTDTVLIFKLLRLFPAFQYTPLQRVAIVAIPSLLTIPRIIVMALLANGKVKIFARDRTFLTTLDFLMNSHLPLIEFSMQLASNLYCSVILLIKAYTLLHGKVDEDVEIYRSEVMVQRLRIMLRATLSSFLIPVCIQLALVIVFTVSNDLDIREPLQWTNTYVSLHCAVLATVWSSIGDATGTTEEQERMQDRRKSSTAFIQLERDGVVGEGLPGLHHQRSELSAIQPKSANPSIRPGTKRSVSPFCEGDSVEVTPNSYQLSKLHLATPSSYLETPVHKPDYHANDLAGYDAVREMNTTRRIQRQQDYDHSV
ncbi:uncharacterized protein FA14DRAFT_176091 [Meira miltonrushii]|uniref:Uncharacterized protein n=1 Tax=Meira miltonrushii TaxID=1280837 RepID=A0A316VGW7_9BASI|nr:uncharacterized protein FA14DRAFT_176091 [Meira miltonrushii]PWN36786.1 hypothetical protein FA14DRAFT_176091 [Meira miltonrushii]